MLWIKMIDIQKKLDVKNIHDLIDKEIKGKCKTNNPTNEQIKNHKTQASKLIDGETFVYVHEGFIIPVIIHLEHQNHISLIEIQDLSCMMWLMVKKKQCKNL